MKGSFSFLLFLIFSSNFLLSQNPNLVDDQMTVIDYMDDSEWKFYHGKDAKNADMKRVYTYTLKFVSNRNGKSKFKGCYECEDYNSSGTVNACSYGCDDYLINVFVEDSGSDKYVTCKFNNGSGYNNLKLYYSPTSGSANVYADDMKDIGVYYGLELSDRDLAMIMLKYYSVLRKLKWEKYPPKEKRMYDWSELIWNNNIDSFKKEGLISLYSDFNYTY